MARLLAWMARWFSGRWFFARTLPVVFAAVSLLSFEFPGDEYGLYVVSSHAGLPGMFVLAAFTSGDVHDPSMRLSIAAAGAVVFSAMGALLDWLGTSRRRYFGQALVLATLMAVGMVLSFPSIARAVAKNGSLTAYALASVNPALEFSAIIVLLQHVAGRTARAFRDRRG